MTKFKFLRKRSDYYRHFTVLDIGTDLIKVLVVRREGPDGEVLGVGREPQAPAAMSGGAIADLESVIQACNRALEAAEDMARTVPGQVVVGIAGAQPYALARACANEEVWAEGGIFVDVGGGTTDVALIRDGGVEGTRMFNLGGRAFTRRLALAFGLSYEEAEARKLRHSEGLLSADQHRQVSELLSADAEVLLQGLALSIKELSRGERLPSSIYLCGGGSLLPELTLEMVKNNWAAGLPFPREPRVRHLVPPDVRNLTDSTGQLSSPQDIAPMGLANHALRTETEERDTVNSVMRRVLSAIKA